MIRAFYIHFLLALVTILLQIGETANRWSWALNDKALALIHDELTQ